MKTESPCVTPAMFESKMTRHQRLLKQEKSRAPGVLEEQAALPLHSRKTNDLSEFEAYLKAKKEHDCPVLPAGKMERLEV